jgi:hypothetical protein
VKERVKTRRGARSLTKLLGACPVLYNPIAAGKFFHFSSPRAAPPSCVGTLMFHTFASFRSCGAALMNEQTTRQTCFPPTREQ